MTLIEKMVKGIYTRKNEEVSDMQGPCDTGFHIPTDTEMTNLRTALVYVAGDGGVAYFLDYLHMPLAGYRNPNNYGAVANQGSTLMYWCCTADSSNDGYRISGTGTTSVYGDNPEFGVCIRAFKDTYETPDSTWTVLAGTLGSDGIFWNSTLGLISIKYNTTEITIQDKNVGATSVYSRGDTRSEANCGKYFQWGNNYGFPFTGSITTSTTQVNAQSYGPSNPYSSSTYIYNSSGHWDSSNNTNLRGGVTQQTGTVLTEHKIRPEVPATAITLNKSSISLTTVGQTEQLTATLTPADSTSSVSWTSSNTSIATVSSTGLVTCVTPGSCTITATTDNGLTATCSVKGQWAPSANTIFYYDFNQNLNDSSGKGNNPTANAYIGYATQGGQYVASTTGNSPYIQLNKTYGNGLTNFTISFWIYPMKTSGQGDVLVFGSFEEAYPYNGPTIFFLSGGNILVRMGYDISKQPCTWTQNTRQHIVFTRSSGTCSFYKNGALQGTSWTDTRTWNADVFFVFSRNESNQQFKVVGTKGDKYIYENVAWSADDVTDYYNSTKSIYGL